METCDWDTIRRSPDYLEYNVMYGYIRSYCLRNPNW